MISQISLQVLSFQLLPSVKEDRVSVIHVIAIESVQLHVFSGHNLNHDVFSILRHCCDDWTLIGNILATRSRNCSYSDGSLTTTLSITSLSGLFLAISRHGKQVAETLILESQPHCRLTSLPDDVSHALYAHCT